jgi:hypothetical protein
MRSKSRVCGRDKLDMDGTLLLSHLQARDASATFISFFMKGAEIILAGRGEFI